MEATEYLARLISARERLVRFPEVLIVAWWYDLGAANLPEKPRYIRLKTRCGKKKKKKKKEKKSKSTHARSWKRWSISSSTSVGSEDRDSTIMGNCSVACCTFGQRLAPAPSIPLESAPHDRSEGERGRDVMGPPPPWLVTRRDSYRTRTAAIDPSSEFSGGVILGVKSRRLNPANWVESVVAAGNNNLLLLLSPDGFDRRKDETKVPRDSLYCFEGSVMFVLGHFFNILIFFVYFWMCYYLQ